MRGRPVLGEEADVGDDGEDGGHAHVEDEGALDREGVVLVGARGVDAARGAVGGFVWSRALRLGAK